MKLIAGSAEKENEQNRKRFLEAVGIEERNVVIASFVHGAHVATVSKDSEKVIPQTDALVTAEANVVLAITIADCIPVYFYETQKKIIGLAHAGWRGVVGNIVKNTIDAIIELGGNPKDIAVMMGPGINACHFEIKEDVLEYFANHEEHIEKQNGKMFVDLKGIITQQLREKGIEDEKIENDNACTFEDRRFFSYRRDKPKVVETMIAVMIIR